MNFGKIKNNNGLTLIEALLYLSIAALILLVVSVFLTGTIQSRVKNQTIAEVEQSGQQVMNIILQTIRNAETVTAPTQGNSDSALELDVYDVADDPTIFTLNGDTIQVTEGAGSTIDLTSSRIVVSSLTFENLTRPGRSGSIRVEFTLNHVNPAGRNEFDFEKTFVGAATIYN
jgi:Tfp pilus assembly protein PilW